MGDTQGGRQIQPGADRAVLGKAWEAVGADGRATEFSLFHQDNMCFPR